MLKAHQQESNWQTDPMIIHTIPFNSKQYHPNNTIAWETRPCGLWAGAKHVHTHFMPKNVINFPPYFYQNFPSLAPTSGDSKCIRKYFPRFFNQNFPHLDIFLSPFPIPFLSPFRIHFYPCLGYTFCPCFRYTFYPSFRYTFYPRFRYPVYLRFCSRPFQAISTAAPNAAMHSLYCALSPTSEQDTTPAPDAAMHLCTVPCPQRQNRTQHQRIRMYSSPLV